MLNILKVSALSLLLSLTLLSINSNNAMAQQKNTSVSQVCSNFNSNPCGKIKKSQKKNHTKKHTTKIETTSKQYKTFSTSGVFDEASRYAGLSEKTDTKTIQSLTGVNPRKTKWCAAFINAVLNKKGYRTSGSLKASSFKTYGAKVASPQKGDIVVLHGHAGFFVQYITIKGRKFVALLGGNQSNRVQISHYPANRIITIRRPVT